MLKSLLSNSLGLKFVIVLFLLCVMQIPVAMVSDLINERSYRHESVQNEIAQSSSGPQQIFGPYLEVKYFQQVHIDDKVHSERRRAYILPQTLDVNAKLDSFEKYRGIYKARLYHADTKITGQFDLEKLEDFEQFEIDKLSLVFAMSDSRGLLETRSITINQQSEKLFAGTGNSQLPQGFHIPLEYYDWLEQTTLAFDFDLKLLGMKSLKISPIGVDNTLEIQSEWPHPSFMGDALPVNSNVNEQGFSAIWKTKLSTDLTSVMKQCTSSDYYCSQLPSYGVSLIDPVDHYLKSHRSVNYSLLVITLVFAGFFLLELFQARPVHPIQYGFVGLALAIFYLMLISMSEHIGFNLAYAVSAFASTFLLTIYVTGMLNDKKHGLIFGVSLVCLYGLLFGLLLAESYALLMGTLLCFAVLSLVMLLTRNVDWYQQVSIDLKSVVENQIDKQKSKEVKHKKSNAEEAKKKEDFNPLLDDE